MSSLKEAFKINSLSLQFLAIMSNVIMQIRAFVLSFVIVSGMWFDKLTARPLSLSLPQKANFFVPQTVNAFYLIIVVLIGREKRFCCYIVCAVKLSSARPCDWFNVPILRTFHDHKCYFFSPIAIVWISAHFLNRLCTVFVWMNPRSGAVRLS